MGGDTGYGFGNEGVDGCAIDDDGGDGYRFDTGCAKGEIFESDSDNGYSHGNRLCGVVDLNGDGDGNGNGDSDGDDGYGASERV